MSETRPFTLAHYRRLLVSAPCFGDGTVRFSTSSGERDTGSARIASPV